MPTMQVPRLELRAQFIPSTWNPEARTIDVVWTAGARGIRMDIYGERYYEELEVSDQAVRLERLNSGAAVLDAHQRYTMRNQIGVVERAWISGGKGYATIRFSKRDEIADLVEDVVSGIIRNLSFGYNVFTYEITESASESIPTYRGVDWEPYEISFLPIGFDIEAQVRSDSRTQESTPSFEVQIRHPNPQSAGTGGPMEEARAMPNPQTGAVNPTPAPDSQNPAPVEQDRSATPTPAPTPADNNRAIEAERNRAAGIMELVRRANLGSDLAERLIGDGTTIDQARAAVIDQMIDRDPARGVSGVTVTRAEADTRRQAMEDALTLRAYPTAQVKPEAVEAARQYRGMSLVELAREAIEAAGGNTRGMSKNELAGAALNVTRAGGMNSTSDFPLILANVANKTLRRAYEMAPQTWRPIVREVSAADFKEMQRVQLGDAPRLERVNEGGEFKRGTISEAKEAYSIATYGKVVAITRQTIINDDLGAFTRLPELFGRAAADLESDTVWAIITANAAMADGVALFHASHANLGTAAAIAVASLGEARKLMRLQTGLNGENLNVMPKFLVVPAALETIAEQYLTSTQVIYTKGSDVNPMAGKLQLLTEPRLDASSATAWYLAADPAAIDTIEVAYLDGQRGVYLESREGFDVDGVELKARLDFGAAAIDHRGLVKNAGA